MIIGTEWAHDCLRVQFQPHSYDHIQDILEWYCNQGLVAPHYLFCSEHDMVGVPIDAQTSIQNRATGTTVHIVPIPEVEQGMLMVEFLYTHEQRRS